MISVNHTWFGASAVKSRRNRSSWAAVAGGELPNDRQICSEHRSGNQHQIIDLNAVSYQAASGLRSRLRGYVNSIADFDGGTLSGVDILPADITSRELVVGIPSGSVSSTQQDVLDEIVQYGADNGVVVSFVEVP